MTDSEVIDIIRHWFDSVGGKAAIPLFKGKRTFTAQVSDRGVWVDNLANQPLLPWRVFTETVSLLRRNGGTCRKGDAMKCRLGDEGLELDSIEGHVAHIVYGMELGQSVFRRITPIACILAWCGICENGMGECRRRSSGIRNAHYPWH